MRIYVYFDTALMRIKLGGMVERAKSGVKFKVRKSRKISSERLLKNIRASAGRPFRSCTRLKIYTVICL